MENQRNKFLKSKRKKTEAYSSVYTKQKICKYLLEIEKQLNQLENFPIFRNKHDPKNAKTLIRIQFERR